MKKPRIRTPAIIAYAQLTLQVRREQKRIDESIKKLAETKLVPGFTRIYC